MAKEVETNKDGLQVIVDRYGIVSYNDATAIVVNSVDKEKADEALTNAEVTHRVFDTVKSLSEECISEEVLQLASSDEEKSIPVIHREEFVKEIGIDEAISDGGIQDIACDYVAGLDKEEQVDSVEENTKEEATATEE